MFDHTPSQPAAHAAPMRSENPSPPPVRVPAITRVSSSRLLAGGRELVIEHAGQEYHLRLTRNDKLILTK